MSRDEQIVCSERLKRGALPLEQALEIARQMASALAAAHELGMVHTGPEAFERDATKSAVKLTRLRAMRFGARQNRTSRVSFTERLRL